MSKLIGRLLVVLAFGWTGSAGAGLLPPVTVNGLEWLQPVDFVNLSWTQMATACNPTSGVCNGSLGGNDITGWTWAGVEDINALFNHYMGSPLLGPGPDAYGLAGGASWVYDMIDDGFMLTWQSSDPVFAFSGIHGILRRPRAFTSTAFTGHMYNSLTGGLPFLLPITWAESNDTVGFNEASLSTGGWFFKDPNAVIPAPITDTLALVGLGLCALRFAGRKRT